MGNNQNAKKKKELIISCIFVFIFSLYIGLQLGVAFNQGIGENGADFDKIWDVFIRNLINPIVPFTNPNHWGIVGLSLIAALIIVMKMIQNYLFNKNTLYGKEHGSSSFNTDFKKMLHDFVMSPAILSEHFKKKYKTEMLPGGRKACKQKHFNKKEIEYCKQQSQVYSQNVGLSLDTKLTQLNLNAIIFGGSGSGKSRFYVTPNLLQANSSYVCTDPSGELMRNVGKFLQSQGYIIKCLNITKKGIELGNTQRYNPFAYVKTNFDIPIMVNSLIDNIEGPKKGGGGDGKFWDETSRMLLIAICGYLLETQPLEKRNFNNVSRLLTMANLSEDKDPNEPDDLDLLFDDLEKANPNSYAIANWKALKQAGTGKTAQNIFISTTAILTRFFSLPELSNLTYKDDLNLEEIGRKKCALFIVTDQGDTTYNFLASMLYTQLFDILYKQGEQNAIDRGTTSPALDVPVRCLIDEAANVGVIPNFAEKISTCRKYRIAISPIYQNQAQVKTLFKDNWEVIVGNCDTMLFLGGIDTSTVKMVSERLGKATISTHSNSVPKGKGSGSTSISTAGRELMTTTELEQMANDHCVTFIRSMKPFYDLKYPLEKHPNYKYSADANEKNAFINPWNLDFDRELMRSIEVKRVNEEGYVAPKRAEGVTDEEVERVERDIAKRSENSEDNPVPIATAFKPGMKLNISTEEDVAMENYEDIDDFEEILKKNADNSPTGYLISGKEKPKEVKKDVSRFFKKEDDTMELETRSHREPVKISNPFLSEDAPQDTLPFTDDLPASDLAPVSDLSEETEELPFEEEKAVEGANTECSDGYVLDESKNEDDMAENLPFDMNEYPEEEKTDNTEPLAFTENVYPEEITGDISNDTETLDFSEPKTNDLTATEFIDWGATETLDFGDMTPQDDFNEIDVSLLTPPDEDFMSNTLLLSSMGYFDKAQYA